MGGSPHGGCRATLTVRRVKSYNLYERKAYISYRKETRTRYSFLNLGQGKHSKYGGQRVGGREGKRCGRGGSGRWEHHWREAGRGDADVDGKLFQ